MARKLKNIRVTITVIEYSEHPVMEIIKIFVNVAIMQAQLQSARCRRESQNWNNS